MERFILFIVLGCFSYVGNAHKGADLSPELGFIENKGQWESEIRYKVNIVDGALFVTDRGFVYTFESAADRKKIASKTCDKIDQGLPAEDVSRDIVRYHAYRVNFVGAQLPDRYTAEGKKSYYHNYFLGKDPASWASHVRLYNKVVQHNLYPGIDAAIYSHGAHLKYDFVVAPGADPSQIALSFQGVQPELTKEGHLKIRTTVNEIEEQAPYVYQVVDGIERMIPSRYRLLNGILSYELLDSYDTHYPLIIDPILVFSTYSGSTSGSQLSYATTYDKNGNLYAGAHADSPGWPTTIGAYQRVGEGQTDVGINKYSSDGSSLLFSTYYGGTGHDIVHTMMTNEHNELYIAGTTSSTNLPLTKGCYDSVCKVVDIFVAGFDATGAQLKGSTYIGGAGLEPATSGLAFLPISAMELALDKWNNVWVVSNTNSTDFPVTANAFQAKSIGGKTDGVLFQLNADCSSLLYSTYLGGKDADWCFNLVINNAGQIVVCGATKSLDFPTTAGTMQPKALGNDDGFISIFNATTGALLHSTFIGTSNLDRAYRLQVDQDDHVYVLGTTAGDYPISPDVFHLPATDIFIDKLSANLATSLLRTRIGNKQASTSRMNLSAFLVDICGNIYVSGFTGDKEMPTTPDAFQKEQHPTLSGLWLCVFNPDFQGLKYASYCGDGHGHDGINRFDPKGFVYQSVCTTYGRSLITKNSLFPEKKNGSLNLDVLSFKFDLDHAKSISRFQLADGQLDSGCAPYPVQFVNNSVSTSKYTWDFGDGSPLSHERDPKHTYTKSGTYQVALYVENDPPCRDWDTSYRTLHIFHLDAPQISAKDTVVCQKTSQINLSVDIQNIHATTRIQWGPIHGMLTAADKATIAVDPYTNLVYYVRVTDTLEGICSRSSTDTATIDYAPRQLAMHNKDTIVCEGAALQISTEGTPGYQYLWAPTTGVSDSTISEPVITIMEPNIYTLTASYPNCPDTTIQIVIGMEKYPKVSLGPDQTVCWGAQVALEATISPFNPNDHYTWQPKDKVPDTQQPNIHFPADSSGVYSLLVQSSVGCSGSDSIRLTVIPPNFSSAMSDTGYCLPGQVTLWATGGTRYLWQPAYGLSDSTAERPLANPSTTTNYVVYAWDSHGCRDSQQVKVDVWPGAILELPDSVTIYSGERFQLEPGTNCHYFEWFPPSGLSNTHIANPSFAPEVRTRYFVSASTENGCTLKDSMDVLVACLVIDMPNAFSPQSTEGNGIFKPAKRGIAQLQRFVIYNRWGEKVFESNKENMGWDGSYKGIQQPLGVYVYEIEGTSDCGVAFKKTGNVTLLR